jgi:hypothetical protein
VIVSLGGPIVVLLQSIQSQIVLVCDGLSLLLIYSMFDNSYRSLILLLLLMTNHMLSSNSAEKKAKDPTTIDWLKQFCNHIAEWNSGFEYDDTRCAYDDVHRKRSSNCHGFVDYMMRVMNIDTRYLTGSTTTRALIDLVKLHPRSWYCK